MSKHLKQMEIRLMRSRSESTELIPEDVTNTAHHESQADEAGGNFEYSSILNKKQHLSPRFNFRKTIAGSFESKDGTSDGSICMTLQQDNASHTE